MPKVNPTRLNSPLAEPWLKDWYAVRPDIDRDSIALIGRIFRLHPAWERYRAEALRSLGITPEVSDLTISLLRAGKPYELSPTELSAGATLTSGAITNRIDRAEAQGYVKRVPNRLDRRGVKVRLTRVGVAVANMDVDVHMELAAKLMSGFDRRERSDLLRLLSKLLAELNR